MEIQLQELIEQIKKDGVEAAEAKAEAIVKAAQERADKIVADAQAQAEKMIAGAKSENERMVKSSEEAIMQAGRNLLISFRESVTREMQAIVSEGVTVAYAKESLAQLIVKAVEAWVKNPDTDNLSVMCDAETVKAIEETVLAGLKEKMLSGVTLKPSETIDGGFRITADNGSAYYDYSAEAVVEMLSSYLSPKVTRLLKEA